jgi:hypothetical protein
VTRRETAPAAEPEEEATAPVADEATVAANPAA